MSVHPLPPCAMNVCSPVRLYSLWSLPRVPARRVTKSTTSCDHNYCCASEMNIIFLCCTTMLLTPAEKFKYHLRLATAVSLFHRVWLLQSAGQNTKPQFRSLGFDKHGYFYHKQPLFTAHRQIELSAQGGHSTGRYTARHVLQRWPEAVLISIARSLVTVYCHSTHTGPTLSAVELEKVNTATSVFSCAPIISNRTAPIA